MDKFDKYFLADVNLYVKEVFESLRIKCILNRYRNKESLVELFCKTVFIMPS